MADGTGENDSFLSRWSRRKREVEAAEAALRALGFREFRVRHHDQVARIEVARDELQRAVAESEALTAAMKEAGFLYATLDLAGFRSGSMNEALKRK